MRRIWALPWALALIEGLSSTATACPQVSEAGADSISAHSEGGEGSPRTAIAVGPRLGVSVNHDQWVLGGHVLLEGLCLAGLGLEPILLVGIGGNHATLRPGMRVGYTVWFDDGQRFGLMATAGIGINVAVPVGGFSDFCDQHGLTSCGTTFVAVEAGGGVRYDWLRLELTLPLHGELPVLTSTFAIDWPM